MKLFKNILILTVLMIGLFFTLKPAQAADYSVTFGAPFLVGSEFEGKISDRFSYCIDGSYYWLLGAELTAFSVGGKYYFNGETMDGMYIGTQIGNMHGSGKFLGIFETDGDDSFAQLRLGYKKATARGFTYDLGIYGVCWDDGDVDGGVSFGFGYSW